MCITTGGKWDFLGGKCQICYVLLLISNLGLFSSIIISSFTFRCSLIWLVPFMIWSISVCFNAVDHSSSQHDTFNTCLEMRKFFHKIRQVIFRSNKSKALEHKKHLSGDILLIMEVQEESEFNLVCHDFWTLWNISKYHIV